MIYNNIQIFNKAGKEIPLFYTSNLIFTTACDLSKISDNDIVLYGCYDGNDKTKFSVKIIQPGKIPGNIIKDADDELVLNLKCFHDGILVKDDVSITIKNPLSHLSKLYYTNYQSLSPDQDNFIANKKEDNCYYYYTLSSLSDINIYCDLSFINDLIFPSMVFLGKIEMEKVSTGLVETETLIFGNVINDHLEKLSINNDNKLKLLFDDTNEHFKFLTLDEYNTEIVKSNSYTLDASNNFVNIGFFPDKEGVYEQSMYICLYNTKTDTTTKIGEITIISEAIGEDERYRALFDNFGILNPSTYFSLFKDHNPSEENINWDLINKKSKELFLTYDQIFPYIGTYKALINSINFLGYNDIYFREWYKIINNDGNDTNVSYRIDLNGVFGDIDVYENKSIKEYKKLNKLSMVYKINQETGKYDKYDIPIIENVYDYSVTEVLTKLIALKLWLERNIIAVNCKILEITGEGVIYEKQDYIAYGTVMQNIEYSDTLQINPKLEKRIIELIDGSANINVSNIISSTDNYICVDDFDNVRISDFYDNQTIEYPYITNSIVKGYVDTSNAIINDNLTKPLWINNGELYFITNKSANIINVVGDDIDENDITSSEDTICAIEYGALINSTEFINPPIIQLQCGYIRKDEFGWDTNIQYTILPSDDECSYKLIDALGNTVYSYDNIILYPMDGASLKYTYDNVYNVPMFKIKNYKFVIYNNKNNIYDNKSIIDNTFNINEEYILDIQDGKILNTTDNNTKCIINFNYDFYNNGEQNVSVIYEYLAEHKYTPKTVEDEMGNKYCYYDEYFTMTVNNIGHYNIIMYSFNDNGNIFVKEIDNGCEVVINKADINIYTDQKNYKNDKIFYYKNVEGKLVNINNIINDPYDVYSNNTPLFRNDFIIKELSYGSNNDKKYIQYPNISYAIDTAKNGYYIYLQNIVDKFEYDDILLNDDKTINHIDFSLIGNKTINSFPSVLSDHNDTINIVIYNSLTHKAIYETSAMLDDIFTNKNNKLILRVKFDNNQTAEEVLSYIDDKLLNPNYECYIQPTTEYAITEAQIMNNNYTKLTLDNNYKNDYNKVIFNSGDCIKLIYSMIKYSDIDMFIETQTLNTDNKKIYEKCTDENNKNEYKLVGDNDNSNTIKIDYYESSNKYFYTDKSGKLVQVSKLYDTEKIVKYNAYATYRVVECTENYIIIDNIFNYDVHNKRNVLGLIPDDKIDYIDPTLISQYLSNYYIIRYKNSQDEFSPVIMKDTELIKFNDTTYAVVPSIASLNVSKAHQAYVSYGLIANNSEEYFNSYNRIYTDNNRLYSYLDNSFNMMICKFDKNHAHELWCYEYIQPEKLYVYNEPITLNSARNNKIVLASKLKDQPNNYTYWKVYIKHIDGTRKLLFEVLNNKLVLNLKDIGIYDIEAYNYDMYGNLSLTEKQSYIRVI